MLRLGFPHGFVTEMEAAFRDLSERRWDFKFLLPGIYCTCPEVRNRSCVPLSRCTFFVEDTIVDSCVALVAAESSERPSSPNTPLLLDSSRPDDVNPPTAPEERVIGLSEPPAATGIELAVFITVPVAEPVDEETPPTRLPPPRAVPRIEPMPAPEAIMSSAPEEIPAVDCADARA